jgi:transcriptional regulator with XRE-family HTH domain
MRRRRFEFADAFALVLEKHRTAKKLSRQTLAEKAGVHQTYVGMIERGLSNPSLNAANAIAKALQVPFSRLVAQAESLRERAEVRRRRMSVKKPKSRKHRARSTRTR